MQSDVKPSTHNHKANAIPRAQEDRHPQPQETQVRNALATTLSRKDAEKNEAERSEDGDDTTNQNTNGALGVGVEDTTTQELLQTFTQAGFDIVLDRIEDSRRGMRLALGGGNEASDF